MMEDEATQGVGTIREEEGGMDGTLSLPPRNGMATAPRLTLPAVYSAEDAVRVLMLHIGMDPEREGLRETPSRVVKALVEMTAGTREDAGEILGRTFLDSYDEVVILRGIGFTSLCEHHLLPFTGTADVGYLPGKVVGLSKLARLVDCYARRPQLQERMTRQIGEALMEHLGARGAAVVVRASHSCLACRGAKKQGAEMITSVMLGVFRENGEARAEFLSLCRGNG